MHHEQASDRTSIGLTGDGLIRLRTPEGQEMLLTPDRAIEWSEHGFTDRLILAALDCPAALKVN